MPRRRAHSPDRAATPRHRSPHRGHGPGITGMRSPRAAAIIRSCSWKDAEGMTAAAAADPKARAFLRDADPVLARVIDGRPDFRPRAWLDELPPLSAFGTLIFQVVGQQLSVAATRTIVSRLEEQFG